jgi:hypothetical protein
MRVWLMDEGSYPSGFAGGAFTRDHPDQRMMALAAQKTRLSRPGILRGEPQPHGTREIMK